MSRLQRLHLFAWQLEMLSYWQMAEIGIMNREEEYMRRALHKEQLTATLHVALSAFFKLHLVTTLRLLLWGLRNKQHH